MGWLAALGAAGAIAVTPLAGVVVDRRPRRPVLIASDLVGAAVLLTVPLAALFGHLGFVQLAVVTAVIGGSRALFETADQRWLPRLVGRRDLGAINALAAGASAAGETGGPALLGALVQWVGAPLAIGADALAHLVSAASLWRIRLPEPPAPPAQGVGQDIRAGLAAVWTHPVLRPLALTTATFGLFGGSFGALYAVFALRTLALPPLALGLLIAAGGAGSLLGSGFAGALARRAVAGPWWARRPRRAFSRSLCRWPSAPPHW